MRRIAKTWIVLFCMLLPASSWAQSERDGIEKLDPRFGALISGSISRLGKTFTAPPVYPVSVRKDGTEVYGAIIRTNDPESLRSASIPINSILPGFVTARLTISDMIRLMDMKSVEYVEPHEELYPTNDLAVGRVGADILHSGYVNGTQYKGQGVIVCIIDTGIDWSHGDFCDPSDPTKSRILYIWDQTISPSGGESSPGESGCNYGVEYTKAHIDDEIDGSPAGFVRENDTHGHGTHVAGTAAGNGSSQPTQKYAGLAPMADIIVVKAGNETFPSNFVIDALNYVGQKAASLGKPVVVNMSLGSNSGPHDGTDVKSVAIDAFSTQGPGYIAVSSAGNEGDNYIHLQGSIPGGGMFPLSFDVPDYTAKTGVDNDDFDFDIYFDGTHNISADMTSPNGYTATQASGGSNSVQTDDGSIYLNNNISAENGDRNIYGSVWDDIVTKPPADGTWTLTLHNHAGSTASFHCWLYDYTIGDPSATVVFNNADEFFTLSNTAQQALTVASYAHRWRWTNFEDSTYWAGSAQASDDISPFSSYGPTRDNRMKPDIAAPGQRMASARSKDSTPLDSRILHGIEHSIKQGTSMATPVVSGAVALLLQYDPTLTFADVLSLLTSNADTDSYTGAAKANTGLHTPASWNNRWGYGRLNIFRAMVHAIDPGASVSWARYTYDSWDSNPYVPSYDYRMAVRFTPTFDGEVKGVFFHLNTGNVLSGPLMAEVRANNGGIPGSKLGNTASFDHSKIMEYSWNYFPFDDAGMTVNAGNDYHVVIYPQTGDNWSLRAEDSLIDNRTSASATSGATWVSQSGFDIRFRPVVATARSSLPSGVEMISDDLPGTFELGQNYPNPFNPETTFEYRLPRNTEVSIKIYNVLGKLIREYSDGRQSAGQYRVTWDGSDEAGRRVTSGVYFIRMEAGDFSAVRKMTLIR